MLNRLVRAIGNRSHGLALATLVFSVFSGMASRAEILWSGDFSTGDFTQWHAVGSTDEVHFHLIPAYGRPIQYGGQNSIHVGNGELLSLVAATERTIDGISYSSGPTRGDSPFSAKFTVKNSANGAEPADCDAGGNICTRRRTELTLQKDMTPMYDGLPYQEERWIAFSVYVPADWSDNSRSWGPTVFNVKPRNESGSSGSSAALAVSISPGSNWTITHRWANVESPPISTMPWQHQMFYTGDEGGRPYPRIDSWPDGLRDFPDVQASHAALQSLNKGGWTDWVIHLKFDARSVSAGGSGFVRVWKREDNEPWLEVLHILPRTTTRGGLTFSHGIGYAATGGYGPKIGMYMDKSQVWNDSKNRVLYHANMKVADASSEFSDLSPDGSSPGEQADLRSKAPALLTAR